jgi:hypothetical protein
MVPPAAPERAGRRPRAGSVWRSRQAVRRVAVRRVGGPELARAVDLGGLRPGRSRVCLHSVVLVRQLPVAVEGSSSQLGQADERPLAPNGVALPPDLGPSPRQSPLLRAQRREHSGPSDIDELSRQRLGRRHRRKLLSNDSTDAAAGRSGPQATSLDVRTSLELHAALGPAFPGQRPRRGGGRCPQMRLQPRPEPQGQKANLAQFLKSR